MKYLIVLSIFAMFLFSCKKDDNRKQGVCYCEFFSGDSQEFDLSNLPRQEQIDSCNVHDNNAANFGGECELE